MPDRAQERFDLESRRRDARLQLAGAYPIRVVEIGIGTAERCIAPVDVDDDEVDAVEGIELEPRKALLERGNVQVEARLVELVAELESIDQFGLELSAD